MIEAEDVLLECAEDTAYRLCASNDDNKPISGGVFSSHWDRYYPNRLLTCMQDGRLRTLDFYDGSSNEGDFKTYNLIFRRFTPVDTSVHIGKTVIKEDEEKRVHYHWDKMVTIPDRPDELIFVLGVSNALMYTALPSSNTPGSKSSYDNGPPEPFLASNTRTDYKDKFIYGAPVVQILSHKTRITSVDVSMHGHVVASGDDQGNVKLLLLRLLDSLSVSNRKKMERNKKNMQSNTMSVFIEPNYVTPFLSSYQLSMEVHKGCPIFAIHWLPVSTVQSNEGMDNDVLKPTANQEIHQYGLVTGSADRAVRVWRITCSTTQGLTMAPMMVLNMLSTHVLCLNAYLMADPSPATTAYEASSKGSSRGGSRRGSVTGSNVLGEVEKQAASIFLSAGTNTGTIYVWRMSVAELEAQLLEHIQRLSPESNVNPSGGVYSPSSDNQCENCDSLKPPPLPPLSSSFRNDVAIDDGSKLHSLLQSSDRPIVHIALSSGKLLLRDGRGPGSGAYGAQANDESTTPGSTFTSRKAFSPRPPSFTPKSPGMSAVHTPRTPTTNECLIHREQTKKGQLYINYSMILAASDTNCTVRLHCVDSRAGPDPDLYKVKALTPASIRLREQFKNRNLTLTPKRNGKGSSNPFSKDALTGIGSSSPFVLVGEKAYASPVMACCFQEMPHWHPEDPQGRDRSSGATNPKGAHNRRDSRAYDAAPTLNTVGWENRDAYSSRLLLSTEKHGQQLFPTYSLLLNLLQTSHLESAKVKKTGTADSVLGPFSPMPAASNAARGFVRDDKDRSSSSATSSSSSNACMGNEKKGVTIDISWT